MELLSVLLSVCCPLFCCWNLWALCSQMAWAIFDKESNCFFWEWILEGAFWYSILSVIVLSFHWLNMTTLCTFQQMRFCILVLFLHCGFIFVLGSLLYILLIFYNQTSSIQFLGNWVRISNISETIIQQKNVCVICFTNMHVFILYFTTSCGVSRMRLLKTVEEWNWWSCKKFTTKTKSLGRNCGKSCLSKILFFFFFFPGKSSCLGEERSKLWNN